MQTFAQKGAKGQVLHRRRLVHRAGRAMAHGRAGRDDQPEDTGLLDTDGNPIFRASERIPMGFDLSGGK